MTDRMHHWLVGLRATALLLGLAVAAPAATQTAPQPQPPTAQPQQMPGQPGAPGGQTPPPLEVSVTGGISAPLPIAIPTMPTAAVVQTAAGSTDALGRQLSAVMSADLKNSGLFNPLGVGQLKTINYPEVTAPEFDFWSSSGAQALVQGFVREIGRAHV